MKIGKPSPPLPPSVVVSVDVGPYRRWEVGYGL